MMFYVLRHDHPWPLLFVLALVYLTTRWGRSGRREEWKQRMAAFGERSQQWRDEQRSYQEQVLAELRRQSAATEVQNGLLRQLIEERASANPASPE